MNCRYLSSFRYATAVYVPRMTSLHVGAKFVGILNGSRCSYTYLATDI